FDANFHTLHPVLITRYASRSHGSLLRRIGSALARAFEPDRARGRPADGASVRCCNSDNGVVKSRLDASQAVRHYAALALLFELFFALGRLTRRRCGCSLLWFWFLGQCIPP